LWSESNALAQIIPVVKTPLLRRPKEPDHRIGVLWVCLQILPHHDIGRARQR
jgi:hypothetical protein